MADGFSLVPIAATVFGIPQFVPQLVKVRRSGDTAGVSWSWAALTSVGNAAWFVYFWLSSFWTALAPASSAAVLAGTLAVILGRRGHAKLRPTLAIVAWVGLLAAALAIGGRTAFGSLLAASFVLQVIPSLWTAFRTTTPTGISAGTWSLIFAELLCWGVYGLHEADPRLIVLGGTGVTASVLILSRVLIQTHGPPGTIASSGTRPRFGVLRRRRGTLRPRPAHAGAPKSRCASVLPLEATSRLTDGVFVEPSGRNQRPSAATRGGARTAQTADSATAGSPRQ